MQSAGDGDEVWVEKRPRGPMDPPTKREIAGSSPVGDSILSQTAFSHITAKRRYHSIDALDVTVGDIAE